MIGLRGAPMTLAQQMARKCTASVARRGPIAAVQQSSSTGPSWAPLPPSEGPIRRAQAQGRYIDVEFQDGNAYRFHAIWLRDACRDATHVSAAAGERILSNAAVVTGCQETISASELCVEDGVMRVQWDDGKSPESSFDADFLRTHAKLVAAPLTETSGPTSPVPVDVEWLRPYCFFRGGEAPPPGALRLWAGAGDDFRPREFKFSDVADTETNLEMLKALTRDGMVVVDGMPEGKDASALEHFTNEYVGSLQKDPARDEANWKISKKEDAQSISYNQDARLNNHTDQSIPSHGAVGLLLAIHYIDGHGFNTVVDGFAAGEALRKRDPEAFKLLTTYHVDAERDYIASRVDAAQNHTNSLLISTKYPLLQTDAQSALWRVQYNEVFRTPSSLPFDVFPRWYAAYQKFVDMLHSEEFERTVPMRAGRLILLQNWRVLHGRAGEQSPSRTLVGGTITRENFYSKACQLVQRKYGVAPSQVHAAHAAV